MSQLSFLEILQCMEIGGLDAVIPAMNEFKNCPRIQEEGARLISSLIEADETNSERIGFIGGLELISLAMINFPYDEAVQEKCCHALLMLSGNAANVSWMIRANVIHDVLFAMERYMNKSSLQKNACETLKSMLISNDEAVKMQIIQYGGVDLIRSTLRINIEDGDVLEPAFVTLTTLGESI